MKTKAGYVAIIGKPNVGKSTLMNALIGEKLSITTKKPQTTRKNILGILSDENYQIIFLDTPGILKPSYLLQKKMVEYVLNSVKDADVLLFMIDASADPNAAALQDERVQEIINKVDIPKIMLVNKIDLSNETVLTRLINSIEKTGLFKKVIPISASLGANLSQVLDAILEYLPEGPKFYPDDQLSDRDERFFVSELIREKIFEFYRDEVPFSTEVIIEEFKERDKGKDYISASIIVEKETQKPIIIGKNGEQIKKLGKVAREAVEHFLGRPVFLELRVKVRPKWRSNPNILKRFGYVTGDEK